MAPARVDEPVRVRRGPGFLEHRHGYCADSYDRVRVQRVDCMLLVVPTIPGVVSHAQHFWPIIEDRP